MAANGRGLFSLYIYKEKLEKYSCQKPLDRFHYNLAKMFPWWPSTKIVQVIVICQNMAARGWSLFSLYIYVENLKKSSCQKPLDRFHYTLAERFYSWPFTKIVQAVMICQNMAGRGGAYFPYIYIYIENLKKSSCQKPLDRFQYNLADMFPWWPFIKIVQPIMICQKTWLVGGGAYFPRIST